MDFSQTEQRHVDEADLRLINTVDININMCVCVSVVMLLSSLCDRSET